MKASPLFDLEGRVALVTGGSRGIGLAIAEGLGEVGASVVIVARKAPALEAAAERLTASGITVHPIVADIGRPESTDPLVDEILDRFGTLDILVNNAVAYWVAPAEEYPDSAWQKVMDVGAGASFRLAREFGRRVMIPNRRGRIINIGSLAGIRGNGTGAPEGGHFIAYHAAKGALTSMTRGLAVEWGRFNINVNCLCPGFVETDRAASFQDGVAEHAIPMTPAGRFGSVEDMKGAAIFLAADASAFVTGQVLVVDGGLSAN